MRLPSCLHCAPQAPAGDTGGECAGTAQQQEQWPPLGKLQQSGMPLCSTDSTTPEIHSSNSLSADPRSCVPQLDWLAACQLDCWRQQLSRRPLIVDNSSLNMLWADRLQNLDSCLGLACVLRGPDRKERHVGSPEAIRPNAHIGIVHVLLSLLIIQCSCLQTVHTIW